MKNFRPLLGYQKLIDPETLKYPIIASVKEDGFRCSIVNGKPLTRSGKEIANIHVRKTLEALNLPPLDGELVLRGDSAFHKVQSAFSSYHTKPDFQFVVFDCFEFPSEPYEARFKRAGEYTRMFDSQGLFVLARNFVCNTPEEVWSTFHTAVSAGDEGLILRDPKGKYKFGRSTLREGIMLKLKPAEDAEAVIVGINELMHNEDAGNSTRLENMVPGGMMGSLLCQMPNGIQFSIGTGDDLTVDLRTWLWNNKDKLIGKTVTYTYHKLTAYGVPREPRLKGARDLRDL